jgi:hypothetical protein
VDFQHHVVTTFEHGILSVIEQGRLGELAVCAQRNGALGPAPAQLRHQQPHLCQGGTGQLSAVQQQAAKKHQQVVGHSVELETKGIGPVGGTGKGLRRDDL